MHQLMDQKCIILSDFVMTFVNKILPLKYTFWRKIVPNDLLSCEQIEMLQSSPFYWSQIKMSYRSTVYLIVSLKTIKHASWLKNIYFRQYCCHFVIEKTWVFFKPGSRYKHGRHIYKLATQNRQNPLGLTRNRV